MSEDKAREETRFRGAGVSPGIARGTIHVVRDDLDDVARYRIEPSQIANEIGRFETALIQTRMQILEMQQKIAESIGAKDAAIFDAHLLVVEDRTLIDEVLRKLEKDLCNVEWVFHERSTRKYYVLLAALTTCYKCPPTIRAIHHEVSSEPRHRSRTPVRSRGRCTRPARACGKACSRPSGASASVEVGRPFAAR